MTMSAYFRVLRAKVGRDLLILPATSVVVFDDDDRFILVRNRERGVWVTVGGMLEPFEQPADGAVREAWEEVGLSVRLTHLIGVFGGPGGEVVYTNGDRVAYNVIAFGARVERGRTASRPTPAAGLRARRRANWH